MKICTILGTRPEIIRLSETMRKLDKYFDHKIIWTGQNYDPKLSDIFWDGLSLRRPDYVLACKADNVGEQIGKIFSTVASVLEKEKPDRVLILGDTNSGLAAIVARRMGIPVYHMEAGNRCWDQRVPEEINRRAIDGVSSVNLCYTNRSRENLIQEGFPSHKVLVTGNPIYEVLQRWETEWKYVEPEPENKLVVATFHRSENVDNNETLNEIISGIKRIASMGCDVVCSIHPRTRQKLEQLGTLKLPSLVQFLEPMDFFEFVKLQKKASVVLTDSGTVQEEACILQRPCVVMRNSTERPETIEAGATILSGPNADNIFQSTVMMLERETNWEIPFEYSVPDVSDRVVKILSGISHDL